jgi:choline-glycine betaine transporter
MMPHFHTSVDPEGSMKTLVAWRTFLATAFTWLFQGSKAIFLFFLMYILYRYGHIHLANPAESMVVPEFSTVAYFSMIFATGAGPIFFAFSVAEPLMHQHSNFFAQAGYRTQDEVDMFAINVTLGNWGISTWATFTIVAVATALAVHRFGLPLALRSGFYPIFGAYTWGWIGDVIDGVAIVLMILGVCSMVCSSTIQVVSGFVHLGWIDEQSTDQEITTVQKTFVWVTTFISIASVISGLYGGIRYMSLAAVTVAVFLCLAVWTMDDTKFILNLQVQAVWDTTYSIVCFSSISGRMPLARWKRARGAPSMANLQSSGGCRAGWSTIKHGPLR